MGLAASVALAVTLAAQAGIAATIGHWLDQLDPVAANAALGAALCVPVTLGAVALDRHRASVAAQAELARRARHDPLTGLPNRSALEAAIARAVRTTGDGMHLAAVLFLDLDRFKQVNDSYGHEVGDELMIAVAERITEALGPGQMALRHGGDEFVVVAGGVGSPAEAEALAGGLVRTLEAPFELGPDTVRISVSIGVALSDSYGGSDDLVGDADLAMYAAKAGGPGSVRVFEPAMRARLSRSNAATQLQHALARDELQLRYVPVLDVLSGDLVGVRAEQRWTGRGGTPVAGRQLSDALEHTGLIVEAGNRALRDACAQATFWSAGSATFVAPQVTVPVSPRQLAQAGFRDFVARTVGELGLDPAQLCLVVGDRALAHEITDAWTMLRHVRTLGVQVALEGFGAGTSSLADIRCTRVDQLWLHPDLVGGLLPGSDDETIVGHVIEMAHELGVRVVADQVATATQHALLRRLGCDLATGSFFGVDLGAEDVEVLLPRVAPPAPAAPAPEPGEAAMPRFPKLRAVR